MKATLLRKNLLHKGANSLLFVGGSSHLDTIQLKYYLMYLNFFLDRQYLLQETKSAVPMHVSYSLLKVVHNTIVHYRIHKNKRCNLILLKVMVLELSENSDFGVVSEVISVSS